MDKRESGRLSEQETLLLCQEIRDRMIDHFSREGGYLAENLSAVEATVELQRIFDDDDILLFSSDHLSYAQKILCEDGCGKSFHDNVSLAEAMGVVASRSKQSQAGHVVYVMSDGDILDFDLIRQMQANGLRLIIVYLDRHDKDVNALNKIVNDLRQTEVYNGLKKGVKKSLSGMKSSEQIISGIHKLKDSIKKAIIDEDVFRRYNIDYLGPIDGHSHKQLSRAFHSVRKNSRLVVVHCLVKQGKGYSYAENGQLASCTLPFNRKDGRPYIAENETNLKPFTIIGRTIRRLMAEDDRILCISNSTVDHDGLADLFASCPDRCLQVKTGTEDFLYLVKGAMETGIIPCVYIDASVLMKQMPLLNEIASLRKAALFYCFDDPSLSRTSLAQLKDAYVIHPKDARDLANAVYTLNRINEPVIIITEKRCLFCSDTDPSVRNDLGKWHFLVNNEKAEAAILGSGTGLLKLKDVITANAFPYDLIDCECLNLTDEECLTRIRKNYKHVYYCGPDDGIGVFIGNIKVMDGDMEQLFDRIKKDLHA